MPNNPLPPPHTPQQVLNPGRPPLAAPQGRWPAAWSLVRSILRVGRGSGSTAPSATEDSSEEELQMRLCELHSTIYLQVGCAGRQGPYVQAAGSWLCCMPPPRLLHGALLVGSGVASKAGVVAGLLPPHCVPRNIWCRLRRRCAPSGPRLSRPPMPVHGEPIRWRLRACFLTSCWLAQQRRQHATLRSTGQTVDRLCALPFPSLLFCAGNCLQPSTGA